MNTAVPPQTPAAQNASDKGSGNEHDLIAALREQGAFSFDSYASLSDVLQGIEEKVGEALTRFSNTTVKTKLDELKVFSVEDFALPEVEEGEEAADTDVLLVQLYDNQKNPICAITVPSSLFFFLLEFALGGESSETDDFENMQISEAENAVFYVFCQSIADGLYAGISEYSELNGLVSGESGNVEEVAEWVADNDLITIKLAVQSGKFSETVLMFMPIVMLEPMREAPVSDEVVEQEVLDLDWVKSLNSAIDNTKVNLRMVLANSEFSLGEIGRLVKGQCIDMGIEVNNVPVCDLEGNMLFCANLEMFGEERQLRVTGSIKQLKGAGNDLFN